VLSVSEREQRGSRRTSTTAWPAMAGIACLANVLKRKSRREMSSPEAQTAAVSRHCLPPPVETHELGQGLYPVSKDPEGLMRALTLLSANVSDCSRFSCGFSCDPAFAPPDSEVASTFTGSPQEAVSNSLKHGRATQDKYRASAAPGQIVLMNGTMQRAGKDRFQTQGWVWGS